MWPLSRISDDDDAHAPGSGRPRERRRLPLHAPMRRSGMPVRPASRARAERMRRLRNEIVRGRTGDWCTTWATSGFLALALTYAVIAGGHGQALSAVVLGLADSGLSATGFTVDKITVTGRQRTRMADILAGVGVERGNSILSFDTDAAKFRIEQLGWVRSASVRRVFPDKIYVEITERRPFAVWQRDGLFSVIDNTGARLNGLKAGDFAHLPRIVGAGAGRKAAGILGAIDREPLLKPLVRAAVRVGNRRWNLQMTNDITILLPEKGAGPVLAELVKLEKEHNILSRDVRKIDFRLPDRVAIRLLDGAADRRRGAVAPSPSMGGRAMLEKAGTHDRCLPQ